MWDKKGGAVARSGSRVGQERKGSIAHFCCEGRKTEKECIHAWDGLQKIGWGDAEMR